MTSNPAERAAEIADSDAFRHAPVAMSIVDLDGRQLAANPAFDSLFGIGPGETVTVAEITHPDEAERTDSYLDQLATNETGHVIVEKRYVRRDGSEFIGRLLAASITDDAGTPLLLLGAIDDMSEHHALVQHLQAASDAKSQFVARVSHDVRTPLHAIAGLAELLNNEDLSPAGREFATAIASEAAGLRALVDDLLDLARIETGTISVVSEPFDLKQWLDGVTSLFKARLDAAGILLGVETGAELAGRAVVTDADRLRQIVVNLLDNACKFTDSGSVLVVASHLDGALSISVVDSGRGVSESALARIFEPFVQTERDDRGAGLGLAVGRQLAVALGGDLTAVSEVDFGSTFTVTVPAALVGLDAAAVAVSGPGPTDSHAHVLVVEDVEVNRLLVTSQLARLGVTCETAENGMKALELLDAHRYDLVLMDWHLPDIDGLEVTRRFRAIEESQMRRPTPIVAVTARAMAGDRYTCLEAGMDDFLAKPVSLDDLERAIATWAGTRLESLSEPTPTTPAETLGGVVDIAALDRLIDDLGDRELAITLLETYLDELPSRASMISAAHDASDVQRAAHTLVSTSATVGAVALSAHARSVEQAIREHRSLDNAMIDHTAHLADATLEQLSAVLQNMKEAE